MSTISTFTKATPTSPSTSAPARSTRSPTSCTRVDARSSRSRTPTKNGVSPDWEFTGGVGLSFGGQRRRRRRRRRRWSRTPTATASPTRRTSAPTRPARPRTAAARTRTATTTASSIARTSAPTWPVRPSATAAPWRTATRTASPTTRTSAPTRPRTRTASRTTTAAPIPTTTRTASPTRRTSARTSPRPRTATRTRTAAPTRSRRRQEVHGRRQGHHVPAQLGRHQGVVVPVAQGGGRRVQGVPGAAHRDLGPHLERGAARVQHEAVEEARRVGEGVPGLGRHRREAAILTVGYGPDKPIEDNATKDGQEKNRRIEFRLLSPERDDDQPVPEDSTRRRASRPRAKGKKAKAERRPTSAKPRRQGRQGATKARGRQARRRRREEEAEPKKHEPDDGCCPARARVAEVVRGRPRSRVPTVGLDGRGVVDARDLEAEERAELLLEAGVVGEREEVLVVTSSQSAETRPWSGGHLEIVDADAAPASCAALRPGAEVIAEEARDLLGGPLVRARGLHHLVEHADVERHDRDRARGLGDQRLVDADVGGAAEARAEPPSARAPSARGAPWPCRSCPSGRSGRSARARCSCRRRCGSPRPAGRRRQRAHPERPVLAAHHLARGLDVGVGRGRDLDGRDLVVAEVDALAANGAPSGLAPSVADAVCRIGALGAGQAVDDAVELGAALLEARDRPRP